MPSAEIAFLPVQLPHDWSTDYPVEENAPSCGSCGYAQEASNIPGKYDYTLEDLYTSI